MGEHSSEGTYSEIRYNEMKEKLNEFRDNNVSLMKERDALVKAAAAYQDVDLEKYQQLLQQEQDLSDKKLLDSGKVEELVASKVKTLQDEHSKQYAALNDKNTAYERQLEDLLIDSSVKDLALKFGVIPSALNTVSMLAKDTFTLVDGVPTALDPSGNTIAKAGSVDPLDLESWVKGLESSDPYLFSGSSGSGSRHKSSGKGSANEVDRATFDSMDHAARSKFAKDGGRVVDA